MKDIVEEKKNSMEETQKFKLAILQMRSEHSCREGNIQKILSALKDTAEEGADLLLLPECFITGYHLPIGNQDALAEDDESLVMIRKACRELEVGVVATAFTRGEVKPQNSAFVIDKDGEILMKYSKVHTCDFADECCLEPGREFNVCDFQGVKLGVMICYDREYPESARVLMLKGAEIILVPNDCGAMRPRVQALSTRAYENMVAVAMANPDGENAGCSCAFSPICWDREGKCVDNTLLMADEMTEGLYFVEIDLKELRQYREREMMGNTFRKVTAYGSLLDEEVEYPFVRKRGFVD